MSEVSKARIIANRPNAQEFDSPESKIVRKLTYEFISKNMQNEPNLEIDPMVVTKALTSDYDKKTLGQRAENEPKTNPNEPNFLEDKPHSKPENGDFDIFMKILFMQNEPNLPSSSTYFEAVSQSKCCGFNKLL